MSRTYIHFWGSRRCVLGRRSHSRPDHSGQQYSYELPRMVWYDAGAVQAQIDCLRSGVLCEFGACLEVLAANNNW